MPKRPCALIITDDDSTIITADKFGDVYSLPLLLAANGEKISSKSSTHTPEPGNSKPFVPAANDLTVHSQRNLKALENQKRQANKPSERMGPTFEHKLLLGHVSMLTDIALGTMQERKYIITADRDEHIRISRGTPQAHIIENFCLGHTEFVSRVCIPKEKPSVLVSGGGDDDLFVWEWASGQLAARENLRSYLDTAMSKLEPKIRGTSSVEQSKVAVSGITHVRLPWRGGFEDLIIVICEG
jgi:tRNA (guanine-N(7)-)-methyltransferase subunit TRM82